MTKHKTEVAVLGAGPAGSIAACQLGQAGFDVVLIDAGSPQGGHVIETLPPSGSPLAEDIGLLGPLCEISDGPAAQMQMLWREQAETRHFTGDGPLLLQRDIMHQTLRGEALEVARMLNARVRSILATSAGAKVTTDDSEVQCQMVVDARGRHAAKRQATPLVALAFAAKGQLPPHAMWLEAMQAGWIWATTLEQDTIHGVVFQEASRLAGLNAQQRLDYAASCLSASQSFADVTELTVGTPTAAGLSAVDDPVLSERHILIGDAALARDPIASHGLVHAMRSGVQAAIAVRTILDPASDSRAALEFLRHKHSEAVTAARRATTQAYHDQDRFRGPFWTQFSDAITPPPSPLRLGAGPVALANPLTRAPVLDSDRIRWAPAIKLLATRDFFTGFGPVTALDIATACRPSASLQEIAARLGHAHAMPVVFEVLEHLTLGGAFTQASQPS